MESPNTPSPEDQNPQTSLPSEPTASTPPPSAPAEQPAATPPSASGGISEQQWIVFLNISALAGFVVPSIGHILGPLIIWLVKKPESPAIDAAGRNVLNFQISWTIWMVASVVIAAVGSCLVIPIVLPFAVGIAWIIFVILGTVKASNGEPYTFPLTIKML